MVLSVVYFCKTIFIILICLKKDWIIHNPLLELSQPICKFSNYNPMNSTICSNDWLFYQSSCSLTSKCLLLPLFLIFCLYVSSWYPSQSVCLPVWMRRLLSIMSACLSVSQTRSSSGSDIRTHWNAYCSHVSIFDRPGVNASRFYNRALSDILPSKFFDTKIIPRLLRLDF